MRNVWIPWCIFIASLSACASPDNAGPAPARPPADAGRSRQPSPWEHQLTTDGSWLVDGVLPATVVGRDCRSSIWPDLLPAQWIWVNACETGARETHTFLKTFELPAAPDVALLEILVDDYAYVSINDRDLPNDCMLGVGAAAYGPATVCGFYAPDRRDVAGMLRAGENTLRVQVHNVPIELVPGGKNPAGLSARLTVRGAP